MDPFESADVLFRMNGPYRLLLCLTCVAAALAHADAAEPRQPTQPGMAQGTTIAANGLVKVDQGVTDAGVLNRSLRMVPIDLRVDDGFQNVYEVSGNPLGLPGAGGSTKQYMRTAGGIHAVFPQSEYISTARGQWPVTPAGVVYWIGAPPNLDPRRPMTSASKSTTGDAGADLRVYRAVRLDVDPSVQPGAPSAATERTPAPPEMKSMEDPAYRVTLLARLAEAEKKRLNAETPG